MIEWITPRKSGRATGGYYLTIAVSRSGQDKSGRTNPLQLCIRFSDQAIKDQRLMDGDRLLIGVDRTTKQVCFKRTTDIANSFKLTSSKSTSTKVMTVQLATDLPWHKAIWINKDQVKDEGTHIAINAPDLFAVSKGGAA